MIAFGTRAGGALVNLGVGIAELDRDVSLKLVLETNRLYPRNSLDQGGLTVGDMTDSTDVDGGLPTDHRGRQWRERGHIQSAQVLQLSTSEEYGHSIGKGEGTEEGGRNGGSCSLGECRKRIPITLVYSLFVYSMRGEKNSF